MTPSLLSRLFGVPLVIIASLVGGAIIVVLAFGAPASRQEHSVEELLRALEVSTGEKSLGMLLPRAREHWQTGLELTARLERKEKEFTETELDTIAARIASIVRAELSTLADPGGPSDGAAGRYNRPSRSTPHRLEFLIRALGLTGRPLAVEPLIEVVRAGNEQYAVVAMGQLGNLAALPESRRAIKPITDALVSARRPETRVMACTVLSVLVGESDMEVLDALARARLTGEGEVAWSAALALARLRSAEGKSTLLDLLDRSFWESGLRYRTKDPAGKVLRYQMPADRVERYLLAAVEAAENLDDAEIWEMIERLATDSSPTVRGKAAEALKARSKATTPGSAETES